MLNAHLGVCQLLLANKADVSRSTAQTAHGRERYKANLQHRYGMLLMRNCIFDRRRIAFKSQLGLCNVIDLSGPCFALWLVI